jgi:hypothetical protein
MRVTGRHRLHGHRRIAPDGDEPMLAVPKDHLSRLPANDHVTTLREKGIIGS